MKRLFFLIALFGLLAFTTLAEEFTISYMTGYASLIEGGRSVPLDIGSSLDESARIEIEDDGVLELQGSSRSLTLTGPGTYVLASVLGRSQKRESLPVSSLLRSRLSRMVSSDGVSKPSSVMGVRGAAADAESDLTWMSGESEVYIGSGREYMSRGELQPAMREFEEGLAIAREYGEFESEMELTFLLSYTQALDGRPGPALNTLQTISPDPYAPWYPEYRLHHAGLLLEAGAPQRAAEVLQSEEKTVPLQEEEQLLLGISLMEEGGQSLKKGEQILRTLAGGSSRAAEIAREYLN